MKSSALWLSMAALALQAVLAPVRAAETPQVPTSEPRTLTVSGSFDVKAVPDRAMLQIGVLTQATTAQEAMAQNNMQMARIVAALKQVGIPEAELQTSYINLSPLYAQPPQPLPGQPVPPPKPPQVIGFQATNTLTADLSDLTKVGPAIDVGVNAGANGISGPTFRLTDDLPYRLRALREASVRARAKADAVAAGLGVTVVAVDAAAENVIQIEPVNRVAVPAVGGTAGAAPAPTPILTGELVVHADVQVRYIIK